MNSYGRLRSNLKKHSDIFPIAPIGMKEELTYTDFESTTLGMCEDAGQQGTKMENCPGFSFDQGQ